MVQVGREPSDFKPLPSVGPGAYEIRVRDDAGRVPGDLRGKARACGLRVARLPEDNTENPAGRHQARGEALQGDREMNHEEDYQAHQSRQRECVP